MTNHLIRCKIETQVTQQVEDWHLLSSATDWEKYKEDLNDGPPEIQHSSEPPEYPCLARSLQVLHGTKAIYFHFFVTQKDAKALSL